MTNYSFKMPDVGEGIVEVEISEWKVAEGEPIEVDQPVADVMTDKANVEITSPVAGRVLGLACKAGDMLAVGSELVLIETDAGDGKTEPEAEIEPAQAEKPQSPVKPPQAADTPPETGSQTPAAGIGDQPPARPSTITAAPIRQQGGKPLASPAVRRRAREADVELDDIVSSDSSGRITHQDLDAHIASLGQLAIGGFRKVRTGIKQIPLKGLRRLIARNMQLSKQSIPHFSYVEEIDMTDLEKLRQHLNANRGANQSKLTLLPFLMLAMARVIRKYPQCNAHFDDEKNLLTQHEGIHIGVATMTDEGLKVPVVHHVEAMDIWHCAAEIQRLSAAARDNTVALAELSGSTITLTSLGTLGGLVSTPIINHPEVSIIGVNKAQQRVMVINGEMQIRYMMNLSSSFDHRIIDGHTGASFVQQMKALLEHPATLFM
ncbi:MAG: 2-oxo acid dehydrogenase subunit E2 [Gammaproteobacteria bacterium]|nr:2-oxo acid dehydrogenase subunit E2 [Gammaproteobacteria bacterium]